MSELADLVAPSAPDTTATPISIRRARVISVAGRSVKVDIGGGITIPAADSCNPIPNQIVYIVVEGTAMTAIASLNGVNKQATLTVVSSTSTTVNGLVNGVLSDVTKIGGFTVTAGQVIPLLWSADAFRVWAGAPEGAVTTATPTSGGGATGGGGGGVTSGTQLYAATQAGGYNVINGQWESGKVPAQNGAYFFGASRFRELQGRTITGFRANLSYQTGSATISVYGHPHPSVPAGAPTRAFSAGSFVASGWIPLPLGLAAYLIGGSGTGGLTFAGSGLLRPLPYGALQFDWRK